jgi:hypothetical protein
MPVGKTICGKPTFGAGVGEWEKWEHEDQGRSAERMRVEPPYVDYDTSFQLDPAVSAADFSMIAYMIRAPGSRVSQWTRCWRKMDSNLYGAVRPRIPKPSQ